MAVEITSNPTEDPKYVEEMRAKGRAAVNGGVDPNAAPSADPNAAPSRPEWLPEKFNSPEDLAKAYKELESKLGKEQAPKADPAPKADNQPTDATGLSIEQQDALKKSGIDMEAIRNEYAKNQSLSDDTYAALEKAGFTRTDVDAYIEGQKAIVERIRQDAFALVGGEETFTAMQGWARANLSKSEIAAFNRLVSDPDTRETAILGLHAKYIRANGKEPGTHIGGQGVNTTGDVYESRQQLVKDMSNPDYQKDPAFRKKVEEKLARTRKAGKNIWQ